MPRKAGTKRKGSSNSSNREQAKKTKPSNNIRKPLKNVSSNTLPNQQNTGTSVEHVEENDIFSQILKSKSIHNSSNKSSNIKLTFPPSQSRCRNMVYACHMQNLGLQDRNQLKKSAVSPVLNLIRDLQLYRTASPFDRRCTAIEWHPTNPDLIAVGSKGGDMILWNINHINKDLFIQGRGPGGSITSIKFHPKDSTKIFTSALEGKISVQDFTGKQSSVLMDTMSWERWFCSLDANYRTSQLAVGDTQGNVTLLSMEGKQVFSSRLHKQKVNHTEFSRREDWLLVTASGDKTVKVWDLRMVGDKATSLETLAHDKPFNSAYFSLTDGCRLLTTDQSQDIRIYDTTTWRLERTISHPHRFFQHLTPIKAHWHPLQDLIVVGRYPDPNFPSYTDGEKRTIDILDPDSGQIKAQLNDSSAPGIVSLNKFNPQGDMLASTMGVNVLLWRRKEEIEERQRRLVEAMKSAGVVPSSTSASSSSQRRPSRRPTKAEKNTKEKTESTKAKLKMARDR